MIDPLRLLYNALWIAGLALSLASWSIARWRASQSGVRFRQIAGRPSFAIPFSAGLMLCCVGLALGAATWWETAGWAILAVLCASQGAYTWLVDSQTDQSIPTRRGGEGP